MYILKSFSHCNENNISGYKCSYYEDGIEDMVLEGEQGEAHVGKDKVLCQEIQ